MLSCVQLCNPMDCRTPDSSALHHLPEFAQIPVHWVWWCYLTISSSSALFSSCFQSFPASGSFPISWFFASGAQSFGTSASVSVLTMNIQGWCPLGLIGLISLQSEGLLGVFSSTIQKHCKFTNYFVCLSYFKLSILLKYLIMIVDFLILFMPLWSFLVHVFWDCLFKSQ